MYAISCYTSRFRPGKQGGDWPVAGLQQVLLGEIPASEADTTLTRPVKRILLLVGAALAAGLTWEVAEQIQPRQTALPQSACADLAKATVGLRVLEARFACASVYSRLTGPQRISDRTREDLRRLTARQDGESLASALWRQGNIGLLTGDLDRGIALLEGAVRRNPDNPIFLNDLAVGYFSRFQSRGQATELVAALATVSRAVQAGPELHAARFNLGLILERFFLLTQARAAWAESERLDMQSGWAGEARSHLESLDGILAGGQDAGSGFDEALQGNGNRLRESVERRRRAARLYLQQGLLPAWAKAWNDGQEAEAEVALHRARLLAETVLSVTGDPLGREAVSIIERAVARGGRSTLFRLASGHLSYGEGLALAQGERHREALARFEEASYLLERARSPLAAAAQIEAGICEMYLGRPRKTLDRLRDLRIDPEFSNLEGRRFWIQGLASFKLASFSESLLTYRQALDHFARAGEIESVAAMHFLLAENLRRQGQTEAAWNERLLALAVAQKSGARLWFHNTLFDAAEAALKQDLPEVALRFQSEMIESPLRLDDPISMTESHLRRSRTYTRLQGFAAARRDLEAARHWLLRIEPEERRLPLQADIHLAGAELLLSSQPADAAALLGKAISFHRNHESYFRLPELYRERALAYLEGGRDELAEADLAAGVAECERQRRKVLDDQLRVSYFEQVQPIFDEMVAFQALRRGDALRAFLYAEASRARTLLDMVQSTLGSKPGGGDEDTSFDLADIDALLEQIPPGVAVIEYAVLDELALVFILSRGQIEMREIALGQQALADQVERFYRGISQAFRAESTRSLGEELYDALILPWLPSLAPEDSLVLIPDKSLHRLPFAALTDGLSGELLLEQRSLTIAPSLAIYIRSLQRSRGFPGDAPGRPLLVEGSRFDRSLFALDRLPGAAQEVDEIARLYKTADRRTGGAATKAGVLAAAPHASLIHFAAHGVTNAEYPLFSALLLAPAGAGDPGVLYAHEIYRLRLPATRLVILSACGSAGGRIDGGEGVSSLARPFLAAGVPAVVGSLWNVDDRVAGKFFHSFHQRLSAGADPVTALRAAQLAALKSSDERLRNPAAWAGFEVIGGTELHPERP